MSTHNDATPLLEENAIREDEDVEVDAGVQVSNKRSRQSQSWVWQHLTKVGVVDSKEMCRCNHCKKLLSCQSTSGTSHLIRHLEKKCLYFKSHGKLQGLLNVINSDHGVVLTWKFDQERSRNDFVKWMITAEMPFIIVENPMFKKFIGNLQPKYNVLSRFTLKRDCLKMYEVEKLKLMNNLKKLGGRICITTDMWSSIQNLGYMSITAHYIDHQWKLQKKILSFAALASRHTGENIADLLISRLNEWNVCKLCTLTADNASTNDVVNRILVEHFSSTDSLLLNGGFFRVRCWAHILNLIVQDGLLEIKDVITKIRNLVKSIKYSNRRYQEFLEMAQQERITVTKGLCLDVSTRWNSIYLMLESSLLYQKVFNRMKARDFQLLDVPSPAEWKKVELIHGILENFYAATKIFSGQKYSTSNMFFNIIFEIERDLLSLTNVDDVSIKSMAAKMYTKFDKYWRDKDAMLPLSIATVLDPRYKFEFLRFSYLNLYSDAEVAEHVAHVEKIFRELYDEYAATYRKTRCRDSTMQDVSEHENICVMKKKEDNRSQFMKQKKFMGSSSSSKSEIQLYLEDNSADNEEDEHFDILRWWQLNSNKYRILSKLARDILAIQVSTVASESAFSTGGRVLDSYRSRLDPITVEALICTADWIREEKKGNNREEEVGEEEEDGDDESRNLSDLPTITE